MTDRASFLALLLTLLTVTGAGAHAFGMTPAFVANEAPTDGATVPPAGVSQNEPEQEGQNPTDPPSTEAVAERVGSMNESVSEIEKILATLRKLKISGYVQAQYVDDQSSRDTLTGAAASRNRDQFSVRRGRIKFAYTASEIARGTFAFDASSSGVSLKDAYVELTEPWTSWKNTLTAGQFNWPFGFEIGYSSSDREMPERSRVIRALFPGERDRGVMLSGLGAGKRVNYKLAYVNGSGTAQSADLNSDKDLVGRVGLALGSVNIGLSGYSGTDLVSTAALPSGEEFDKERQGVDFQITTPFPGLRLRGEYVAGEERGSDVSGWYMYLIQNVGKRHRLAARADQYDPNEDLDDNRTTTLGASYTFQFDPQTLVMLAYEQPELETADPDDDVMTVRFQFKF